MHVFREHLRPNRVQPASYFEHMSSAAAYRLPLQLIESQACRFNILRPSACIRLDRKRSWINKTAYTWCTKGVVVMGHLRVIAGTLTVGYGRFFPINFPKSTNTQRNKQIMRQRSAVFPHIFLRLHEFETALWVVNLYVGAYISGL